MSLQDKTLPMLDCRVENVVVENLGAVEKSPFSSKQRQFGG
jgi:Leu/Phe-tRNA-protein transferase